MVGRGTGQGDRNHVPIFFRCGTKGQEPCPNFSETPFIDKDSLLEQIFFVTLP
jgi:hypothetical protein